MKKIPSFTIDHNHLLRGIYVSRKDNVGGETITTFDIRMKEPNREPALHNGALHTIEHLAATYLRNDTEWQERIVYWGYNGMSYRELSADTRRLPVMRHCRTDETYLPFHCRIRRQYTRCGTTGLRQLASARLANGKV